MMKDIRLIGWNNATPSGLGVGGVIIVFYNSFSPSGF